MANWQRSPLLPQPRNPLRRRLHEPLIAAANYRAMVLQPPPRIPPEPPRRTDIGPRPQNHIQPLLLRLPHELRNILVSAKVIDATSRLMFVPEHVRRNRVQPHRLRHPKPIAPISPRNPRIVHLARDHPEGLAVQHELTTGNGEAMVRCLLRTSLQRKNQSKSHHRQQSENFRSHAILPWFSLISTSRRLQALRIHRSLIHLHALADKDRFLSPLISPVNILCVSPRPSLRIPYIFLTNFLSGAR